MKKSFSTARRVRTGLLASAGLAAVALSTPAFAQDEPEDGLPADASEPDSVLDTTNAIVVTGTRIRNPNLENLEPTQSLDDTYLEQRNFINAADAINDLPVIRGSVTPDGAQGENGAGTNFVNIFGLGTQRTLTLVNGKRVVSSNSPALSGNANAGVQVDVNIIPAQLIDRVDVVLIGGAPVYGSDAIAGTVNYILKDDYEGFEVSGTAGITEYGDNFRYQLSGIFGTNFADGRGNFVISSNYSMEEGVLTNARDFLRLGAAFCQNSAQPPGSNTFFDNSLYINPNIGLDRNNNDGNPGFVLCPEFNVSNVNAGGIVDLFPGGASYFDPALRAQNFTFNPDGTLRPYVPGVQNRSIFELGGDGFKFADYEQLTSDLERFNVSVFGNYDLTDAMQLYVEGQYFESKAVELTEQPGFNSTFVGNRNGAIRFRIDNPFLTPQARATLQAARPGQQVFQLERVNLDLQNTAAQSENQFLRGVIGVRGDFGGLFGSRWDYDVSFNAGRSKITDFQQDIDLQNYVNALSLCDPTLDLNGAAAGSGVFPGSGLNAIADPNCRPLGLFGEGNLSPEGVEYVTANNTNISVLEQYVVNANVGGDLFNTPFTGNPISFNVGYEFRQEKGRFDASEFENEGRGLDAATSDIEGGFKVNEFFGELYVPLIAEDDDFFITKLDAFGRVRYVDNNIAGGFTAWTVGGALGIIPDVTFRGNYTKSFRAPAITELFSPQVVQTAFVGDFCSAGSIANAPDVAIRQRNCNAFLAVFPNATPLIAQNVAVSILNGGNPNLQNETADSYTFGVIVQPRFVPNLSFSADYVDIELSDPIVILNTAAIGAACFNNPVFDTSDPANGNQFCSLIRRDANGQVPNDNLNPAVTTGFVNGAFLEYEGIEGAVNYQTTLDGIGAPGSLSMRGALTWVKKRRNSPTGVAPVRVDGTSGDPEFSGQLAMLYQLDNWSFGSVINYTGEQLASRLNRGPSPGDANEFDQGEDFVVVDANVGFTTDDDFTINFNVSNLFDRKSQEYYGILLPASVLAGSITNDPLGRSYSVRVTKAF